MSTRVSLYYANWCGFCREFMPEWKALKAKLIELGISHEEYEASRDKRRIDAESIQYFPTIRVSCGGGTVEYGGRKTASDILSFVEAILPVEKKGKEREGHRGGGSAEELYRRKYMKYKRKRDRLRRALRKAGVGSISRRSK